VAPILALRYGLLEGRGAALGVITRRMNGGRPRNEAREQKTRRNGAWYADPFDGAEFRWWDGTKWTDQVRDSAGDDSAERESTNGENAEPGPVQVGSVSDRESLAGDVRPTAFGDGISRTSNGGSSRGEWPPAPMSDRGQSPTSTSETQTHSAQAPVSAKEPAGSAIAQEPSNGRPEAASGFEGGEPPTKAVNGSQPAQEEPSPEGAPEPPSALPTRLCPHCATLSNTTGNFCPYCGSRFGSSGGSRVSSGVKWLAAGVVALLVLGGAGTAIAIKVHHDNQVAAQHRLASERQQQQQQLRQQQQEQQQAKIAQRQSDENQLQSAITNAANKDVNNGVLTSGIVQSTTCTPVSGGSSQNLSESTGTYSCIAVYQTNGDGTQSGYRFGGTINFATESMTWQLGGPA
jgi:hypothetical protein